MQNPKVYSMLGETATCENKNVQFSNHFIIIITRGIARIFEGNSTLMLSYQK